MFSDTLILPHFCHFFKNCNDKKYVILRITRVRFCIRKFHGKMVNILEENNWMQLLSEKNQIDAIRKTNRYTQQFGLVLSEAEMELLVQERRESLKEQQRVEFGRGVLEKLIYVFCDSSYIWQENYADTIMRLQDIFYLYKNESMDELTDDELIGFMREAFDKECQGSLEYLEDSCLESFARKIRSGTHQFMGRYGEDDE